MITIKQEYLDSIENEQYLLARFIMWLIKEKGINPEKDHRNIKYILENYDVEYKLKEIWEDIK